MKLPSSVAEVSGVSQTARKFMQATNDMLSKRGKFLLEDCKSFLVHGARGVRQ
jgi:hypothetical protein